MYFSADIRSLPNSSTTLQHNPLVFIAWSQCSQCQEPSRLIPRLYHDKSTYTTLGQRGKRKILDKFRNLTVETVDLILREEEQKGIFVTQAELVRWAKRIGEKEGKHRNALEMFRWMDRKKMTFSPSEVALYVKLIAKVKGLDAAQDFFDKVDPNFDTMDPNSKNWHAYSLLYNLAKDRYGRSDFQINIKFER